MGNYQNEYVIFLCAQEKEAEICKDYVEETWLETGGVMNEEKFDNYPICGRKWIFKVLVLILIYSNTTMKQ